MEENKICSKCKIEKPIFEFNKNSNTKDNLTSYCKICNNETVQFKLEKNNRERFDKYNKKYFREKYANDEAFQTCEKIT